MLSFAFFEHPALTYDQTARPSDIGAADVDDDGDLDVIAYSTGDDKLAWYENRNGRGDFDEQKIIWQGEGECCNWYLGVSGEFQMNDLENDGDLDIIAKNPSRFLVLEQDEGVAHFNDAIHLMPNATFADATAYDVGDVDGDGDLDIVTGTWANDESELHLYENIKGQFALHSLAMDQEYIGAIRFVDIDSDGDADLLTADITGHGSDIVAYENVDGLGSFEELPSLYHDEHVNEIVDLDVDGDGDHDLLLKGFDTAAIWNNQYAEESDIDFEQTAHFSAAYDAAVGDVNGDGNVDVAVTSRDRLTVRINQGNGKFHSKTIARTGALLDTIELADLDGDRDLDLLLARNDENMIAWYRNDGEGQFELVSLLSERSNHDWLRQAIAADLDADGDDDIITIESPGRVGWYENVLTQYRPFVDIGSFDGATMIAYEPRAAGGSVVDLDNDGDLDILAFSSHETAWFEHVNNANQFASAQVITQEPNSFIETVDVDGDGDQDLVAQCSDWNGFETTSYVLYENEPGNDNGFHPQEIYSGTPMLDRSFDIGDVDGDGDPDLVILESWGWKVSWLENHGAGFDDDPQVLYSNMFGTEFNNILAGDFDLDGDVDVVTSTNDEMIFLENESGVFDITRQAAHDQTAPSFLAKADLDDDGDLDILATSYEGYRVALYELTADGFAAYTLTGHTYGPRSAVPIDVEGDGEFEVLVASESDNRLAIFHRIPFLDFDADGQVSSNDLDTLCAQVRDQTGRLRYDVDGSGRVDLNDVARFVDEVFGSSYGDANLDGVFDSSDVVQILQRGEYGDDIAGNSTWADGDWNCDGEFDSQDLVIALMTGRYEGS